MRAIKSHQSPISNANSEQSSCLPAPDQCIALSEDTTAVEAPVPGSFIGMQTQLPENSFFAILALGCLVTFGHMGSTCMVIPFA